MIKREFEAVIEKPPKTSGAFITISFDVHEVYGTKGHPFGPSTNYELAVLYSDMGETKKALKHLQTTLDVWKNADPEFKPAKLAREKLAELQS